MRALKQVSRWLRNRRQPQFTGFLVFVAAFGVIGVALLLRSFAAGEKLYISPGTISAQTGQDITVTLRLNAGTAGSNAIDATVVYDATKLQFKSVDESSSAFTTPFISTNTSGSVNIVRGITGSKVTGDVEVAKITFTALGSTTTTASLTLSGQAANDGVAIDIGFEHGTVNITAPTTPPSTSRASSFTVESTVGSPVVGTAFGLRIYANSETAMQGGELTVNLPSGLAAQSPYLVTTNPNTAFNPASIIDNENFDTTPQRVYLAFTTQETNKTGKQLIGTIPVIASTAGAKQITFSNGNILDLEEAPLTPVTANAFSITAAAAALPAPTVRRTGGANLTATNDITNLKQSFTITNFDSGATYTATLGGRNLTVTADTFSIPTDLGNGNLPLLVTATKSGSSGNASFTIRLRSPNVNRTAPSLCTDLTDLLDVNKNYGASSTVYDLNFDNTVGLIDLMTVIQRWGGECVN